MATSFHPPSCNVLVCLCQSVRLMHTHTETETEKSRIHLHSCAQRSPAVNHGSVRGRKHTGYFVPWHKSLRLWPGCRRESTVCHTLQIQNTLCHTHINNLSPATLCFFQSQTTVFTSACTAHMHDSHSYTLSRIKQSGWSSLQPDRWPVRRITFARPVYPHSVCLCVHAWLELLMQ